MVKGPGSLMARLRKFERLINRKLRTKLDLIMPETRERGENRQKKFKHCHDSYASRRTFIKGDAFIIEVFQIDSENEEK